MADTRSPKEDTDKRASTEEREDANRREKRRLSERGFRIGGGLLIFLVLGGYFFWIGKEMGSHSSSGGLEMPAIFGAIFLGVVALVAGGAFMRRQS